MRSVFTLFPGTGPLTLKISIAVGAMLMGQFYHALSISGLNNSSLHVNILENSIDPFLYSY